MSGITGIYFLDDQPVALRDLERMTSTLSHRGSDGDGIWAEGPVGLGHRLLWTTPESIHENQPLVSRSEGLVLVSDARIDNREELLQALSLPRNEGVTDSDLILAAYRKWGESCPERLLGDFAFAVWDARRRRLFCARDHYGVKPFYYGYLPGRLFAFASEIKALLTLERFSPRPNEMKIAEHLASVNLDATNTYYADLHKLAPAHSMVVDEKGVRSHCYWEFDPAKETRLRSDQEYAERYRDLFLDAVRCRMRSAYPVGSMLSGGLDSSAITCVARDLLREQRSPLYSFSAVFDKAKECDERPYMEAVLAGGGIVPFFFQADGVSPLADIEKMLWHLDGSFKAGNLYLNWNLHSAARDREVRVLLDGFDGDTTVSHGVGYFQELAEAHRWYTLTREVILYSRQMGQPWGGALWAWLQLYGIQPLSRRSMRLLGRRKRRVARPSLRTDPSSTSSLLNPSFLRGSGLQERIDEQKRRGIPKTERERHYQSLIRPLMSEALELLDHTGAAHSLEPRFPFCDRRLMEFCLSVPPDQKLRSGWSRLIARRAMEGILPSQIQWRRGKANLTGGFDQGLIHHEKDRMDRLILKDPSAIERYVEVDALREAYRRYLSSEATMEEAHAVWRALMLGFWLQQSRMAVV